MIEFIDAKCHCQREECYSTGYVRLTTQEAIRLAKHILKATASKNIK